MAIPTAPGMKWTDVNNHKYSENGVNGIDEITEITWNNIKSMHVKTRIEVKAQTQELPISIYNELYKVYMASRQRMTRIVQLTFMWTPTSTKFSEMATLFVVDERLMDDAVKSAKKEMIKSGKLNIDIMGTIVTAVPFDPNFQEFISGSIEFATATMDINKVKFYISFPDTRMANTNSIAGFMDISWKTVADDNGVYEKVQWDVFTFEKKLPAEVALMSGKNNFMKIKNFLDKKYNERKDQLRQLDEFANAIVYGTDQGLNKMKNQLNEEASSSTRMLVDCNKRIEAIKLKGIYTDITTAKSDLSRALAGENADEIEKSKNALVKVFKEHNMQVPEDSKSDETGFVIIGDAN